MRKPLLAAALALIAGCALTRTDPEKPELPLPEALPAVTDALPELPAPWWRVFDDPALDTLIGEALERNPDIEVAAARVAEARAIARAASAERLPSLGLEAGVERSRESVLTLPFPGARTTQTAYYLQGAVRYELDLWGRYAHASEAARARLLASEFDQEAVRLSLSGEVARGWYALKAATEQLANARESLANREESLRIERIREEGGESDEFTLKRVQAEVAATRTAEQQFELEAARRANALAVLLGRSPREMVDGRFLPEGELPESAPQLPAGLPSSVLELRPDIRAAEANLDAAAADVGVARADLFPRISLTGLFGWASLELDDLFTRAGRDLVCGGRARAAVVRGRATARRRRPHRRAQAAAARGVCEDGAGRVRRSARRAAGPAQPRLDRGLRGRAHLGACARDGTGGASLPRGRDRLSRAARRAPRPVPVRDRSRRRASRRAREHRRPRARSGRTAIAATRRRRKRSAPLKKSHGRPGK